MSGSSYVFDSSEDGHRIFESLRGASCSACFFVDMSGSSYTAILFSVSEYSQLSSGVQDSRAYALSHARTAMLARWMLTFHLQKEALRTSLPFPEESLTDFYTVTGSFNSWQQDTLAPGAPGHFSMVVFVPSDGAPRGFQLQPSLDVSLCVFVSISLSI